MVIVNITINLRLCRKTQEEEKKINDQGGNLSRVFIMHPICGSNCSAQEIKEVNKLSNDFVYLSNIYKGRVKENTNKNKLKCK